MAKKAQHPAQGPWPHSDCWWCRSFIHPDDHARRKPASCSGPTRSSGTWKNSIQVSCANTWGHRSHARECPIRILTEGSPGAREAHRAGGSAHRLEGQVKQTGCPSAWNRCPPPGLEATAIQTSKQTQRALVSNFSVILQHPPFLALPQLWRCPPKTCCSLPAGIFLSRLITIFPTPSVRSPHAYSHPSHIPICSKLQMLPIALTKIFMLPCKPGLVCHRDLIPP